MFRVGTLFLRVRVITPRITSFFLASFLTCAPQVALAENKSLNIALYAQPMAETLRVLSITYGVSFAVRSEDIAKLTAKPINGRLSLEEALTQLFENTPLTYSKLANGFVIQKNEQGEKDNNTTTNTEELVVYGFQQSLKYSRDIKIDSIDILDAVVSTDFAQYPDLNLAESLQRIPGVTITREAGEGRIVSLRGISPDFTLVTLNGMPVLVNNDSPMDSRGQKQRDRAFDFNIFSTDLFDHAQAIKSYSAGQSAGGIAGTIALKTARPFDQPGFNSALTYQVGKNEYVDAPATRNSALISYAGENWGGLFSYSYSMREVQERGANTFRWRNIAIDDAILEDLDTEIQLGLRNGDYFVPRGNRYSVWTKEQERLGLGAVLQYDSDDHKITFDALYAELDDDRKEFHLYPRGSQSTPVIPEETQIIDAEINDGNELVYARYQNARTAVESRQQNVVTDYQQFVINAQHTITRSAQLTWLLGSEQSEFDVPFSNKVYMQGASDIDIDYRKNRFFADISYYNSDLLSPDNWRMSEIDQEYYHADTAFDTLMFATLFEPADTFSFEVGGEFVQFSNTALSLFRDNLFKDEWAAYDAGNFDFGINNEIPTHLSHAFFDHPKADWLVLDTNATLQHYGINPNFLESSQENNASRLEGDLSEKSNAIFFESNLKKHNFSIKSGVRYLKNTTEISYGDIETNKNNWSAVLPSVNLMLTLNNHWLAKLGLSKNITRPQLADLSMAPTFNQEAQTVYDENSSLRPYTSRNVDISFESYWSTSDLFSVSIFYKQIDDYIVSQARNIPFGETRLFNYWTNAPFSANDVVTLVTKQNTEEASMHGMEIHLQHQFSYWPEPWNNFGIDLQVSLINGQVSYYNENTGERLFKKPMPFLSEKSGALTLYYQTSKFNCRVSANYRDHYIYRVNSNVLSDEDETGFHSTVYMDAQLGYQFSPQWELKVEAFNLSNQREEQYSDSSDRPYNTTSSGRSLYLGLSFRY